MEVVCKTLRIERIYTTLYHLQSNGNGKLEAIKYDMKVWEKWFKMIKLFGMSWCHGI